VTTTGLQSSPTTKEPPHDLLSKTAKAPVAGYAFVFLSNEHPKFVDAYFDDVTFSVTPSMVVQVEDYYPFGLSFNSYQRENSVAQNFKYNGFENEDELGLNVNSSFFRMHDPALGRWWQIDPKPSEMISPYAAMNNNPILYNDLLGDTIRVSGSDEFKQQYQKDRGEVEKTDAGKELFKSLDENPNDVNVSEAYSIVGAIKDLFSEGSGDEDHVLSSNTEASPGMKGLNADVEYSQINGVQVDDQKSQSHLTLTHELSHAKDILDGTFVNDTKKMPVGEARVKSEGRAMDRSNQVAFELGQPQRTVYGSDSNKPITVKPITRKEKLRD
jgi:RHS repeat-associated protein